MKKSVFSWRVKRAVSATLIGPLAVLLLGPVQDVALAATNTWTTQNSNDSGGEIDGIAYGNGLWIGFESAGGYVDTSPNGVNWTQATSSMGSYQLYSGVYGTKWVAVGGTETAPTAAIFTSSDGHSWTPVSVPSNSGLLQGVAFANGLYVAVGQGGTILTSSDGETWTARTSGTANNLWGVAFGDGMFVAVGDGGTVLTSADGLTWTARTPGTGSTLLAVTSTGSEFVAVGTSGTILVSPNGVTWTTKTSGTSNDLYGVAYGSGKIVAAGDNQTIVSSTDGGTTWAGETPGSPVTDNAYFDFVAYADDKFVGVGLDPTANQGLIETQPYSTNANLSSLAISQGTLSPAFSSGTTSYTASVPYTATTINVTPTVADSLATVRVNGNLVTSGSPAPVNLSVGTNTIIITVTTVSGNTQTYSITATRAAASTNATLSNLILDQGSLSPTFSSGTTSYTASVPYTASTINVTPTVADSTATVTVNGSPATSGNAVSVPLNVGSNTITIVVTAQDGTTTGTYTVTVTRAAASTNATLSNLTLDQGSLSPTFSSGKTSYTASVPYTASTINVTATSADSAATMTVNGKLATSGNAVAIPLNVGSNSITVVVTAQDGTTTSTYTVTVTREQAPPTTSTDSGSAAFIAGDNTTSTPVTVDAGLTVTDASSSALQSATISITGNFHSGEDVVSFTNDAATMGNITGSYNASTGVLTMTSSGATATLAQWQSALQSVTYTDTAITPNTATRTVSFTVVDGEGKTSNTATRTVTVADMDQTPIVTTTGGSANYVSGTAPITVDGGVSVFDLDNTTMSSGTVNISAGFHSGDTLVFVNTSTTLFGNIIGSYNAATGVLTLTSSGATATDAQWANALSAVTFSSTYQSFGMRTMSFTVNDGTKNSATATDNIDDLGPPTISTDSGSASFVAGDNTTSTPVVVDSGLAVTDASTLASATIAITGSFHSGQDVLSFTNDGSTMGNIAGSYNATTGVLTMTSAGAMATVAQWQSALESVTYTDTASTPNSATRTISITTVDGGGNTSNTATRTVTVGDTDQSPIVTTTGGSTDYTSGSPAVTVDGGVTVSDRDNTTMSSGTVSISTGFHLGDTLQFANTSSTIFGNITASYNSATGVLTMTSAGATATDAQWASALSAVQYVSSSSTLGIRTISFVVNDGTKTSSAAMRDINATLPATPSGLSTGNTTSTSTTLTWGAVAGATSYNVYENGGSTPIAKGVAGTSYTVSNLMPGTQYSFTITAVNASGESFPSSAGVGNTTNIGSVDLFFGSTDVLSGATKTVKGVVYDVYGTVVPNAIIDLSATIGSWNTSSIAADGNGAFSATWTAPTVTAQTSGTVVMSVYGTVYGHVYGVTPTTITLDIAPPPSIATTTLSGATVGSTYSQNLSATNGFSPYTWGVIAGSLPAGLSLEASTGVISGTPSATETTNFTIQVQDANGNTVTRNLSISVGAAPSTPVQSTPPLQPWPPFTGTNGFDTIVSSIWSGPSGTNWSSAGPDGTSILVQILSGALNQQDALRLTSADPSTLATLTSGLKNVTVLGGYGLNVANDTPNGPIEFWFQNAAWVPGTMVYQVDRDGSLSWVPTETLSSGWLRFTVTPNDLSQGGNFVMVLPNAVKTLKVNEGLLEWNGAAEDMPTVSDLQGTYGALFYVMQALKQGGVTTHWNGKAWTLTVSSFAPSQATTEKPASGEIPVILNGTTVAYVTALVAPDGWTHRPTTYVSINDLDTVLKSLFGNEPDWTNGSN